MAKKTKSKLNVKLFRKIQKLFREKPSKSYMNWFGRLKMTYEDRFDVDEEVPYCNTHLCIAGAALVLGGAAKLKMGSGGNVVFVSTDGGQELHCWNEARDLLEIDEEQAQRLFKEPEWPVKFQDDRGNVTGSKQLAKNMVARIEHFLKTDGAE